MGNLDANAIAMLEARIKQQYDAVTTAALKWWAIRDEVLAKAKENIFEDMSVADEVYTDQEYYIDKD